MFIPGSRSFAGASPRGFSWTQPTQGQPPSTYPTPGYQSVPALTSDEIEWLKLVTENIVHELANSHLMQGFSYTEKNKYLVGQLAAVAFLGCYGQAGKFNLVAQTVRDNMGSAAWSPTKPPGGGSPWPPVPGG